MAGAISQVFTATFDANGFEKQLAKLSRLDQFGAFGRSLNRAGASMRKQAIEEAQAVLNLKAEPIRDVITFNRVYRGDFAADVRIAWKAVPLHKFKGTRKTVKRGLSVQIKKTGSRKFIRSGFMATMPNTKLDDDSAIVLAVRRRFKSGGKQWGRTPLDVLYSTNVRQTFNDDAMQRRVLDAGFRRFNREMIYEINRRLNT